MNLQEATENEIVSVDEGNFVLFKIAIKAENAEDFQAGVAYFEKMENPNIEDETNSTLARQRALRMISQEANSGINIIKTKAERDALSEASKNVGSVDLV